MKHGRGQSMLETMLVLPAVLFFLAAAVQLLWLLLAQQMLQSASLHMVRQAALDNSNLLRMYQVLEKRMRPLPGNVLHVPFIRRTHPQDEDIMRYGDYLIEDGEEYYTLDTRFALARLDIMPEDEREHWLRARYLQYEVVWCHALKVPVAASVLAYFLRYSLDIHQQYCNTQVAGRAPMMAVKVRAAAPLVEPLRINRKELNVD